MKYLLTLNILFFALAQDTAFQLKENVGLEISTYESKGETKAMVMPYVIPDSPIGPYHRRFAYVLMNVSEIHHKDHAEKRREIWGLYPDTVELRKQYFVQFSDDAKLMGYLSEMNDAIFDEDFKKEITFTMDEVMEVGSKFFYADEILGESTVQTHICIGLNGVAEANWEKDYTLLEAFCYEAIFDQFDHEKSKLEEEYDMVKGEVSKQLWSPEKEPEKYLLEVREEIFNRMENNAKFESILARYFEKNTSNLAFQIEGL